MNSQKTASFLYTLRKEKGMTQKELADKLYVTDKAVSKWERGQGRPDISILPLLAAELGVTTDEIIAGAYHTEHQTAPAAAHELIYQTIPQAIPQTVPFDSIELRYQMEDVSENRKTMSGFLKRRFVKVFIILPVFWTCFWGFIAFCFWSSTKLEPIMMAEVTEMMPLAFRSLLFIWFFFCTITGFIPLTLCYIWYRLSK